MDLPAGRYSALVFSLSDQVFIRHSAAYYLHLQFPFGKTWKTSHLQYLQHALHKPVNFFIIPLFALANTAIHLPATMENRNIQLKQSGYYSGLTAGKAIGNCGFQRCWGLHWALPDFRQGMNMTKLIGIGMLAGIGFTMSIFISNLAFESESGTDSKFQSGCADCFCIGRYPGMDHFESRICEKQMI